MAWSRDWSRTFELSIFPLNHHIKLSLSSFLVCKHIYIGHRLLWMLWLSKNYQPTKFLSLINLSQFWSTSEDSSLLYMKVLSQRLIGTSCHPFDFLQKHFGKCIIGITGKSAIFQYLTIGSNICCIRKF